MADFQKIREANQNGEFYVDDTCIDCDVCRWMAPEVFKRDNHGSVVYKQPESDFVRFKALQAMVACPTNSIGTTIEEKDLFKAKNSFPMLLEEDVYQIGYHSVKSYGATSYFIKRDDGNIIIDCPRFDREIVEKLESLGGVKYMYFTHKDPIADHKQYHDHFNCKRIMHEDDINENLQDFEIKLEGEEAIKFDDDIIIIPSPGHTKGLACLLYKDKFLFTGDHLAFSTKYNRLIGYPDFCWHSWQEQVKSMHKLFNYSFEWVLPGHGKKFHCEKEKMQEELQKCVEWMDEVKTSA